MHLKKLLCYVLMVFAYSVQAQNLNICVDNKGKVGFADASGNVVIKCEYESATPFNEGIAVVTKGGKSGIIDTAGSVILPLQYNQITAWSDKLYLVKKGNAMGLVNHSGAIVLPVQYSLISKPNCYKRALIAKGGKATANDKKTYMANAKYGIIDESGNVLIPANYKGLYEFANDGANVKAYHEGKYLLFSYHNTVDTLLTDCKCLGFSNNGFSIYNAGIMDGTGTELVKMGLYSIIMEPQGNMARYYIAKKNETICGYHNMENNQALKVATFKGAVKDLTYWTHGDFIGNIAPVNGTSWSFVDKTGNVVRSGYSSLKHSIESKLWAAQNSSAKWDVFDENSSEIAPLSGCEEINMPLGDGIKELFTVKKDGVYGGITRTGDIVIPFEYEFASADVYDVVALKKNGKMGAFTSNGDMLIPIEYADICIPSQHDTKHFWVKKSDNLYYHYNVLSGNVHTKGYKSAMNYEKGYALVVPVDINIMDTPVNRAQIFAPMTARETIQKANISEYVNSFGYIVNENDEVIIAKPVSTLYKNAVIEEIQKRGNRLLTTNEQKQIMLEVTRDNRTYTMGSKINEEEWNY